MKKPKPKGGGRKTALILSIAILLSVSICFLIIKGPQALTGNSKGILPFLYEEIYSSSDGLTESIQKIDIALYDSFYKGKARKQDILFLNVLHMHEKGHVWDLTEVMVRCPDRTFAQTLLKHLSRSLVALGKDISFKTKTVDQGNIQCSIFSKVYLTHKVLFSINGHRPLEKGSRPKIAIIIDDLGYDASTNFSFLDLELPLTYSVLPYGPFTKRVVEHIHQAGGELLLHLPMEPKNYPAVNPGPGSIFLTMDDSEIREILRGDLLQIQGVKGVNNHMGSSFSENREKMRVVMAELKKKDLYFIDSRTSKNTVALEVARDMGVRAARRRVFLDNNLNPRAMEIQMERLLSVAVHRGEAIGIGHAYKETVELLKTYKHKIETEFSLVPVSELIS